MALGARTNFVGWKVAVAGDRDMTLPVVEAVAECCDFCDAGTWDNPTNQAAEYMVDAVTSLGDGGSNVFYCQKHLRMAIEVYSEESGDVWIMPDGMIYKTLGLEDLS